MTVLAHHPDPSADNTGGVEQRFAGVVKFADKPGHVAARRPSPLRLVVEMGEINE